MNDTMHVFVINGVKIPLSRQSVEFGIAGTEAEQIRLHGVRVDGQEYPVKQVFSAASGLDRLDFTTNQARSALKKLGFTVFRSDEN